MKKKLTSFLLAVLMLLSLLPMTALAEDADLSETTVEVQNEKIDEEVSEEMPDAILEENLEENLEETVQVLS